MHECNYYSKSQSSSYSTLVFCIKLVYTQLWFKSLYNNPSSIMICTKKCVFKVVCLAQFIISTNIHSCIIHKFNIHFCTSLQCILCVQVHNTVSSIAFKSINVTQKKPLVYVFTFRVYPHQAGCGLRDIMVTIEVNDTIHTKLFACCILNS